MISQHVFVWWAAQFSYSNRKIITTNLLTLTINLSLHVIKASSIIHFAAILNVYENMQITYSTYWNVDIIIF